MRFSIAVITGLTFLLLTGCTNNYSNGGNNLQQCKAIRSNCDGLYDEWVQANGDAACTCQRHQTPPIFK